MREAGSRAGPLTLAAGLAPFFLAIFAIGTNLFIVVPLLPAIRHDFPVAGAADLGQFLVSAYALPYALLAPALGPLSDRVGRVPIMVGGMALLGLAAIISAWAPTLAVLAAARGVAGIGAALFTPAAYAHIGNRFALGSIRGAPYHRASESLLAAGADCPADRVLRHPPAPARRSAG